MLARHDILQHFGPGILGGVTWADWWRILRASGFAVDARYWPRTWAIAALSVFNTLAARREARRFEAAAARAPVPSPVFVLGLWRSGTTLLHTLLARDRRFAYPDLYDALNPHTFIGGKRIGAPLLDRLVTRHRLMDFMRQGAYEPVEEDIALAVRGMSSMLGLVLPRDRDHYWRWVTMTDLEPAERVRWRAAYREFVQRLTLAKGRRLVLKSPANTARIPHLLEMFPDAVFVTIHRHPRDVLRSTLHALNTTSPWWRLHSGEFDLDWVVGAYGQVVDAYFRDRGIVPAGRLCEVAYADLVADPVGEVARVYRELGLPDFAGARAAVTAHGEAVRHHRRITYPELPPGTTECLEARWEKAFTAWRYAGAASSPTEM